MKKEKFISTTDTERKSNSTTPVTTKPTGRIKNETNKIFKSPTKPSQISGAALRDSKKPSTTTTTTTPTRGISNVLKPSLNKTKPGINRAQPLRVKHTPEIVNNIKAANVRAAVAKPGIMTPVHNVTVTTPPPKRKQIDFTQEEQENSSIQSTDRNNPTRERTRTRTLDPDEVVVLKKAKSENNSSNSRNLQKETSRNLKDNLEKTSTKRTEEKKKDPVAFEINFPEKSRSKSNIPKVSTSGVASSSSSKKEEVPTSRTTDKPQKQQIQEAHDEYEDDFESYESDFETGSSTNTTDENNSDSSSHYNAGRRQLSNETDTSTNSISDESQSESDQEVDEESEDETHQPITVIHRDKIEYERKLDSGNYELRPPLIKRAVQEYSDNSIQHETFQHSDSMDTSYGNSEQLDSGISYNGSTTTLGKPSSADYHEETVLFPLMRTNKISERGKELMAKIELDTLTFTLFDLKPINYDYYMKIYGNYNTAQISTQTNDDRLETDTQTDEIQLISKWTQHPPQYNLQFVQQNKFINLYRNACDEFSDDDEYSKSNVKQSNLKSYDHLQTSIQKLSKFRRNLSLNQQNRKNTIDTTSTTTHFAKLNEFLNRSSLNMINVINLNSKMHGKHLQKLPSEDNLSNVSKGYHNLNTSFLNALRVVKIFSNSKHNLILTIHESIEEEVYESDFLNLISVWNINESETPLRLLSTWSEVCRAEISLESPDIIVCGLRDGSITMFDLRETYSFCSKLDGYLTHFAATQSIAPSFSTNQDQDTNKGNKEDVESSNYLTDLGAVVDVKSFKQQNPGIYNLKSYKAIQFVSLNDVGVLTIWTLVETGNTEFSQNNPMTTTKREKSKPKMIEYNSPWARVKLIQSAIYDLREYLDLMNLNVGKRLKTKFEKTRSYFENDIFKDDVLKELQDQANDENQNQNGLGLRFTNIDTGVEEIYIGTNRNFVICCSKTLNIKKFRKLVIDESKFLFSTAIRLLPSSEKFLMVGLSNGSVIAALNCNNSNSNKYFDRNINDKRISSNNQNRRINSAAITNRSFDETNIENSCAIQNIIENERRSNLKYSKDDDYYMTDCRNNEENCNNNRIRNEEENEDNLFNIYDQQIVLNGSILRKNLIQNIEISNDCRRLFALDDGNIRIYDFLLRQEMQSSSRNNVKGISLAREQADKENLIILTGNSEVQVHSLK